MREGTDVTREELEIITAEEAVEMSLRNITKDPLFKEIIDKTNKQIAKACASGIFYMYTVLLIPRELTSLEVSAMERFFEINGYTSECTFKYESNHLAIELKW